MSTYVPSVGILRNRTTRWFALTHSESTQFRLVDTVSLMIAEIVEYHTMTDNKKTGHGTRHVDSRSSSSLANVSKSRVNRCVRLCTHMGVKIPVRLFRFLFSISLQNICVWNRNLARCHFKAAWGSRRLGGHPASSNRQPDSSRWCARNVKWLSCDPSSFSGDVTDGRDRNYQGLPHQILLQPRLPPSLNARSVRNRTHRARQSIAKVALPLSLLLSIASDRS